MSMCLCTKIIKNNIENFMKIWKFVLDKRGVAIYNIVRDLRSFCEVQYDS